MNVVRKDILPGIAGEVLLVVVGEEEEGVLHAIEVVVEEVSVDHAADLEVAAQRNPENILVLEVDHQEKEALLLAKEVTADQRVEVSHAAKVQRSTARAPVRREEGAKALPGSHSLGNYLAVLRISFLFKMHFLLESQVFCCSVAIFVLAAACEKKKYFLKKIKLTMVKVLKQMNQSKIPTAQRIDSLIQFDFITVS